MKRSTASRARDRVKENQRHVTAVKNALDRLRKSDTYVKRKNALRAYRRVLRDLAEYAGNEYPQLNKDGSRQRTFAESKPKGYRCPMCNVPMKHFRALSKHLRTKHQVTFSKSSRKVACVCGAAWTWTPGNDKCPDLEAAYDTLTKHLIHQPDMMAHIAITNWKGAPTP